MVLRMMTKKILNNKKYEEHTWFKHGYVCQVPVEFLDRIRYKNSTDKTDMPDGRIMPQEKIFDSIEKDGMQEPLLIVLSPEKGTMRLESGNHRIKVAMDRGYTHLPCAFVLFNTGLFHSANGEHLYDIDFYIFDKDAIQSVEKATYPIYVNPKTIIKDKRFLFC